MRAPQTPSTQSAVHFHWMWCSFESYTLQTAVLASLKHSFVLKSMLLLGKIEINIVKTNESVCSSL